MNGTAPYLAWAFGPVTKTALCSNWPVPSEPIMAGMESATEAPKPAPFVHPSNRYPWVWDYDLTRQEFDDILAGKLVKWGKLDRDWAAVRLIEYAGYREMMRRIGFPVFVRNWQRWRPRVRGKELQQSLDWLALWMTSRHPELVQ